MKGLEWPWCDDGLPVIHDKDDCLHEVRGGYEDCEAAIIRAAVAEAMASEREACCCDMCFWCRTMRDEGYDDVVNEGGGAWIHKVGDAAGHQRCEAETIRARAAASAEEGK